MRLTQGMYNHPDRRLRNPIFGLQDGQMRSDDYVHNGSWYNQKGEKLGFGDLAPRDLTHLAQNLNEGEFFVVLGEYDSFWDLPKDLSPQAPGVDFIKAKCRFVVTHRRIYQVANDSEARERMVRYHQELGYHQEYGTPDQFGGFLVVMERSALEIFF